MSSNVELVGIDIQQLLKSIMRKLNKSSHSCYNFVHLLNSCRGKTNKYYSMLHYKLRAKTGLYFTAYSITKANQFRILGKEKDQKKGIWCKRRVALDMTYVLNFVTWNYTSPLLLTGRVDGFMYVRNAGFFLYKIMPKSNTLLLKNKLEKKIYI